jgi:hypothetical protein
LRIDVLLWLVSVSCLVGLGEVLAREPFADYQFRSQPQDGVVYQQQDQFRWRPLSEEETRHNNSSTERFKGREQNRSVLYPPSMLDYADTPPGLPRGVYRPVEQRHTITPYQDGFRFRTLTPDEQLRTKRRNEYYNQSWQPRQSENRSVLPDSDFYRFSASQRQEAYKFRPDKRLEKNRGGNWGRSYAFPYNPASTEAYQIPMFRPE